MAIGMVGCMSVDSAVSRKTGEEHVIVRNYGWSLFNCIPLGSGDVTLEDVQTELRKKAEGRRIECPVYHNYDSVFFSVFGVPIPYIICYKEVAISGVMK